MRRSDWTPSSRSVLCSAHFTNNCFDRTGQTCRIKDYAVPTLFAVPGNLNQAGNAVAPAVAPMPAVIDTMAPMPLKAHPGPACNLAIPDLGQDSSDETEQEEEEEQEEDEEEEEEEFGLDEHSYATSACLRKLKQRLDATKAELGRCRRRAKTEQQRSRRWHQRVHNLLALIRSVRASHPESANCRACYTLETSVACMLRGVKK